MIDSVRDGLIDMIDSVRNVVIDDVVVALIDAVALGLSGVHIV